MNSYKDEIEDDFNIKEIFRILKEYWLLILTTIILSVSFASIKVYLSKDIYSAFSVVKVKTQKENSQNMILNDKKTIDNVNIQEDIALLHTFYMNNKALNLNKANFKVRYYVFNGYRSRELYKNTPIKITDIDIINEECIGVKLRVTPEENGEYTIEFVHSIKNEIMNRFFKKTLLSLNTKGPFKYNEKIKTNFFSLKIHKLSNFDRPIDIVIYGDNRYIYDNLIRDNLEIVQIDEKIPYIQISYQDTIPSRAVSYIKALTNSFINESLIESRKQSNQILNFIDKELNKIKKSLKASEKKLESYRISNKVVSTSVQASTFIKELSSVAVALSDNKLKIEIVNSILELIKNNDSFDAMTPSLVELKDKPALELISRLQELELKRNELLSDLTVRHPKIKKIDREINIIRVKIVRNIKNLKKYLLEKNRNLKNIKKRHETKIKTLPTKERKMINIKRDYDVSSKMYNFLLEKRIENGILKASNHSKYKIIEKAHSDFTPVGNKSKAILISSIFIGLFLGILLIVLHRIFSDKILTIKNIENSTQIPIYGIAPFLKINKKFCFQKSSVLNSYNSIRTNIQLLKEEPKVIVLNSTIDDEGKNMATINLACSFARVNCKTLIINLDIRCDDMINEILKVNSYTDISSYFEEKYNIYGIIYPTKYENLNIIPVDYSSSSDISKLILSKEFPSLIEKLKESFDYIIINTPPFGNFTDSKYIMKLSDINLVVFRENYSYRSSIFGLNKIIEQNDIDNMGIVFLTKGR